MTNKKKQAQQESLRFMKQWWSMVHIAMMHLTLNMTRITKICQVNLEQFISEEFGFDSFRKSV